MSVSDFTLGQNLFIVYNERGGPKNNVLPVTKIGRKWITVGDVWQERVDAETMDLDGKGYSSPGKAYFSREEWESTTALHKEWDALKRDMPHSPPNGMTVRLIRHARFTLGLPPYMETLKT